jgi:hypothetical protein
MRKVSFVSIESIFLKEKPYVKYSKVCSYDDCGWIAHWVYQSNDNIYTAYRCDKHRGKGLSGEIDEINLPSVCIEVWHPPEPATEEDNPNVDTPWSCSKCGYLSTECVCSGKKYDNGKLRWDLLPLGPVEEVVEILTYGAEKYGPNNWQMVEDWEDRYFAALMRHLVAWRKGERDDKESGLPHLAHALCNLTFLRYLECDKDE